MGRLGSRLAGSLFALANHHAQHETGGTDPLTSYVPQATANFKLPHVADYVIVNDGGTAKAINTKTGAVDFAASSADHAPCFQSAINALAVANGGAGGRVEFKGAFTWASQVILPCGVALAGSGPLGNKNAQTTGSAIHSTYNGPTLLITGVSSVNNGYFPYVGHFMMWGGNAALSSQVLIQVDGSGGVMPLDTFLDHVLLFDAGAHNLYLNGAGKVWSTECYYEGATLDNVRLGTSVTVRIKGGYIFGAGNHGINIVSASVCTLVGVNIWSNGTTTATSFYGIYSQACGRLNMSMCDLSDNGAVNNYSAQFGISSQTYLNIVGNNISDDRGANAVNHHWNLSNGHSCFGVVANNVFAGQKTAAVLVSPFSTNTLMVKDNQGFNDKIGNLTTPFHTAQARIGVEGNTATVTASTTYKGCTPLMLNITGGTGVSITLTDNGGNTWQSGLTTYAGPLPVGYGINFGAFSVAPTVVVMVA